MVEQAYLERIKAYRVYLESEREKHRESSDIKPSHYAKLNIRAIIADERVGLLEKALAELDKTFPELKSKSSK